MRTAWITLGVGLAIWGGVPGCATTQSELKPNLPEEFVLPPENDARFSSPQTFPKETLNTGPVKRFTTPGQQPGAGGGMRGPGKMGGAGGGLGGGGY